MQCVYILRSEWQNRKKEGLTAQGLGGLRRRVGSEVKLGAARIA